MVRARLLRTLMQERAVERIELKIEGMTCGHCVARVEKALAAVAGVSDVSVGLESGSAIVEGTGVEASSSRRAAIAITRSSGK